MRRALKDALLVGLGMAAGWWFAGARSGEKGGRSRAAEVLPPQAAERAISRVEKTPLPQVKAPGPDSIRAEGQDSSRVEEDLGEDGLTADERSERFRREQPEAADALERRRARLRAARMSAAASRREFLASIAEEFLDVDRRTGHAAYREALETRDRLREKVAAARRAREAVDPSDQAALTEAERTVREGAPAERAALLAAAARSVGLEGSSAEDFAETLCAIIEATAQ